VGRKSMGDQAKTCKIQSYYTKADEAKLRKLAEQHGTKVTNLQRTIVTQYLRLLDQKEAKSC